MLELSDRLRLEPEAIKLFASGVRPGQDHLESDLPVELRLPREVNDTHPAAAQFTDDPVACDFGPDGHCLARIMSAAGLGQTLETVMNGRRRLFQAMEEGFGELRASGSFRGF